MYWIALPDSSTVMHMVVDGQEIALIQCVPSMLTGALHEAPFHWIALPTLSTAIHMVVVGQEIEVGLFVPSILTGVPHEVPFHSYALVLLLEPPTAMHIVVDGHAMDVNTLPLKGVGSWFQEPPLYSYRLPAPSAAQQRVVDGHAMASIGPPKLDSLPPPVDAPPHAIASSAV